MIDEEDFFSAEFELKLEVGTILVVKSSSSSYKNNDELLILEVLSSLIEATSDLKYTFIRCLNAKGRVTVTKTYLNIHASRYKILQ